MDAHKAKIPDIVNNSTLIEVPFFQRAYVWKEDLWERFLDDMAFVVQYNRPPLSWNSHPERRFCSSAKHLLCNKTCSC